MSTPSKLQNLLAQMLDDGRQRAQVPQKRRLPNGLHISLTCHTSGITLAIARDDKYPSDKEWETVLNHFPYYVGKVEAARITDNDRRMALRANLPTRQYIAQKLL